MAGLRKGEILGLARRHLDLDAGTIRVERSLREITGQGAVFVEPKSLTSNRIVAMPGQLVAILEEHLDKFVYRGPDALLLTNERGRAVRATVWASSWTRMRSTTGFESVRLHDLRHLAGTMTTQAGGTLQEIMDRLGHSTPTAAMRYQHVANGRARQVADRIGDEMNRAGDASDGLGRRSLATISDIQH